MSRVGNRENGKNDPLHTLKDRSFAMVLIFGLVIVVLAVLWLVMSDQDGKQDDPANEHFRESGQKERSTDRIDPSNSEESPDAKKSAAAARDRVAVKGADDERISLAAPRKGVIILTVRDRDTGAPVQDLHFVAFSEQKRCFLAEGRTRADGRARIEGLPDGTVVIFTERKPPHAQGFRALWIDGGAKIEAVLEVGRGGRAVGRLVDDQGEPLDGYLLRIHRSPAVPSYAGKAGRGLETAAVSGSDGRFEVTHLAASPRWIWIVEGEERPESWESCKIALCTPDHPDEPIWTCHLDLTAEEVRDLGDIVIERGMNYGGRILEADGRPVMGALIQANDRFIMQALYGRPIPSFGELKNPWQEGYDLPPDGDFTDENGRFSIRLPERTSQGLSRNLKVLVWTRDGRRETFEPPETEPGGSILDLEYRLRDDYLIEIALLDAAGMPTKPWGEDGPPEGLQRIGRHHISMWPDRVFFNVSFQGETASWETNRGPDPDGKVRLQIDPARGIPAGLHVTVPGFKTVRDVLPPDPPRRLERQYRLEPLPRIQLQVTLTGALDTLEPFHDLIVIQACLLSPERKSQLDDLERLNYCCDLGARSYIKVDDDLERIIMPVRSQEPFWIYARLVRKTEHHSRKWESVPAQAFGPFEPSETLRSIRLHVTPKTAAEGPAGKSPPGSGAEQDVGSGRLSLRVIDAMNGKLIPHVELNLQPGADNEARRGLGFLLSKEGLLEERKVQAGSWILSLSSVEYCDLDLGEHRIGIGEHLDLGTIRMTPHPVFLGKVVRQDGTPIPSETRIKVFGYKVHDEGNGLFRVRGDLPETFEVFLEDHSDESLGIRVEGFQYLTVSGWTPDERMTLVMKSWCDVEVRVIGLAEAYRTAWMSASLKITPRTEDYWRGHRGREVASMTPGMRRFRFRVPEGEYILVFRGLFVIPDRPIEARPDTTVVVEVPL